MLQNAIARDLIPIIFENHELTAGRELNQSYKKWGIHFIQLYDIKISGSDVEFSYGDFGIYNSTKQDIKRSKGLFGSGMKAYWIPVKR